MPPPAQTRRAHGRAHLLHRAAGRASRYRSALICVPFLVGCHAAAPGGPPYPATTSTWRQSHETAVTAPDAQAPIYLAVLRFYRPGPQQARWLDRSLLPDAPGAPAGELDPTLMSRLIAELGPDRFCARGSTGCPQERGGILRLSLPYQVSADTVRVVASFEGVAGPYAPGTAFSGIEGFLLVRAGGGWAIAEHRPTQR